MNSLIYIFSQAVQSGKTSALLKWVENRSKIGGMLTPDVDGKRMIFDVAAKTFHTFQVETGAEPDPVITGKFIFSRNAFEQANKIITNAFDKKYEWFIIDEIGKLEIYHHAGLEPAVSLLIEKIVTGKYKTKLILVVRNYLLEDAIKHYGLNKAKLITIDFFK